MYIEEDRFQETVAYVDDEMKHNKEVRDYFNRQLDRCEYWEDAYTNTYNHIVRGKETI